MVHESFCLDSQGAYLWGVDDFIGDSLDARWGSGGVGAGTIDVVDAQVGGIVRLAITGATAGNNKYLWWTNIRSLLVSKKVTLEIRALLSSVTNSEAQIGLYYDATHLIQFRFDDGDGNNWLLETNDATGPTSVDSGIVADTDYHIFRIECFPAGEVHFYIDGVECGNSPVTTDIPIQSLMPLMIIYTLENANKSMDVDYVQWRQQI